MALNKSTKSTPTSKNNHFSETTASAGKQGNYLLPVRLKQTPNNNFGAFSCEKKDTGKKLQPVLIKDLLQSNRNDRLNSTITSASTQKRKTRPPRYTQPYLNTQSCHKPKFEDAEPSMYFSRQSFSGTKVRRQLYQNMESPKNTLLDIKKETNKQFQSKSKFGNESEISQKISSQNKSKTSLLLPPNSIKNSYVRKSECNFKVPDIKLRKVNNKKNVLSEIEVVDRLELEDGKVELENYKEKMKCVTKVRDNFTTMSPAPCKIPLKCNTERPTVIVSAINNFDHTCLEMKNLSINECPCDSKKMTEAAENYDFSKLANLDADSAHQLKLYLESSIQACEKQASSLRQILDLVTNICTPYSPTLDKSNASTASHVDISNSSSNSVEQKSAVDVKENALALLTDEKSKSVSTVLIPVPQKILMSDAELSQEAKELSSIETLNEMARLSTIGEVSCEVDDSNKDDSENKENISLNDKKEFNDFAPLTPKTPRNQIVIYQDSPRRSARLAAKRLSTYEENINSPMQDSFTLLENELNVCPPPKLSSKSLPASPVMKPPTTPGVIRQWDKRVEKPLKEYMSMKMNGTFLVTPDIKRFQSALELSDTPPHSRKSLSRKIFMELCDLYADSPEPKVSI